MVWHPNHLPARSQRGGGGKAHCTHVPPRCLATSSWGRETRAPISLSQRVGHLFLEISAQCTHQCHPSPCSGHRFLPQASAPKRSSSPHVPCTGVPPCQLQRSLLGRVSSPTQWLQLFAPLLGVCFGVLAYLSWQPVCLTPSSRKQFVARSDGWRVPLKHQKTDVWALGFGWHTGLRRPALGEGAGQNFIVSGRTTSARDERQHFRSPGYVSGAFPGLACAGWSLQSWMAWASPGGRKHHLIFLAPCSPAQSAVRPMTACSLAWWR